MAAAATDEEVTTKRRLKTRHSRKKDTMIMQYSVLVLQLIFCLSLLVFAGEEGRPGGRGGGGGGGGGGGDDGGGRGCSGGSGSPRGGARERSCRGERKRPHQSGRQQQLVSVFDIFYPHFPPTSNSTFIVFLPGLLRYKTRSK